jgi:DNA polymerase kappa
MVLSRRNQLVHANLDLIGQFFDSAEDSKPSKRQKLDTGGRDNEFIGSEDEQPRFFADDDDEEAVNETGVNKDSSGAWDHSTRAPTPTKPNSRKKPSSRTDHDRQPEETHDCPICLRTLETDNQGLNAHIDWCLSKGLIKDAQASAKVKDGSARQRNIL